MKDGHHLTNFPLPPEAEQLVLNEQWDELDQVMKSAVHDHLKPYLQSLTPFEDIEHMLALRRGDDPDEEDGIWHDDGSRKLAFSWSLNFFGLPTGGTLGVRIRGQESGVELGPYPPGTLIVFQTGQTGFEHRTARVTQGKRLVCAGWCS